LLLVDHFSLFSSEFSEICQQCTDLAHVVLTIVHVDGAVLAGESQRAVASVVRAVIFAARSILTRIKVLGAKRNLGLAELACSHTHINALRTMPSYDASVAHTLVQTL